MLKVSESAAYFDGADVTLAPLPDMQGCRIVGTLAYRGDWRDDWNRFVLVTGFGDVLLMSESEIKIFLKREPSR